jgi:hypothetical protein
VLAGMGAGGLDYKYAVPVIHHAFGSVVMHGCMLAAIMPKETVTKPANMASCRQPYFGIFQLPKADA